MFFNNLRRVIVPFVFVFVLSGVVAAQNTRFDVRHYVIDAKINPDC